MKIKGFNSFIYEAEQAPPADPFAMPAPPAQPGAQPTTPPAQPAPPAQSGTTDAPQSQPPAQQPAPQGEQKSGDLSSYNNESVTKHPDTVKKIVDMIKDLDKTQMIKLRNFIAELKDIEDPKEGIGKL